MTLAEEERSCKHLRCVIQMYKHVRLAEQRQRYFLHVLLPRTFLSISMEAMSQLTDRRGQEY
jgi:hypothetical protein